MLATRGVPEARCAANEHSSPPASLLSGASATRPRGIACSSCLPRLARGPSCTQQLFRHWVRAWAQFNCHRASLAAPVCGPLAAFDWRHAARARRRRRRRRRPASGRCSAQGASCAKILGPFHLPSHGWLAGLPQCTHCKRTRELQPTVSTGGRLRPASACQRPTRVAGRGQALTASIARQISEYACGLEPCWSGARRDVGRRAEACQCRGQMAGRN